MRELFGLPIITNDDLVGEDSAEPVFGDLSHYTSWVLVVPFGESAQEETG